MRREGTDETDVRMSDVLCDYCHAEWTEERPCIEGHQGAVICASCLSVAYTEVVLDESPSAPADYYCTLCRERDDDRAALKRAGDPGWRSPAGTGACACRKCIKLAAGVLDKDPDFAWSRPVRRVEG